MKRIFAVFLALTMLVSALAGCGSDGGESARPTPEGGSAGAQIGSGEYVYVPTFTDLGGKFDYISSSVLLNDEAAYVLATYKDGKDTYTDPETGVTNEYDKYSTGIFRLPFDGGEAEKLPFEMPESVETDTQSIYYNAQNLFAASDGTLFLIEGAYTTTFNIPEGVDTEAEDFDRYQYVEDDRSDYILIRLDGEGTELSSTDISSLTDESDYFYVNCAAAGSDGSVYIASDSNIFVIGPDGTLQYTVSDASVNYVNDMFTAPDGRVMVQYYAEGGVTLAPIDTQARALGKAEVSGISANNIYAGGGDYPFYASSDTSFFGINPETGEPEKLLTWLDCDVDSTSISGLRVLDDGRVVCIQQSYHYNGNSSSSEVELVTLTKTDADKVVQKVTLNLACYYLDYSLRGQILEFNKTNPDYRIHVTDYSEFDSDDGSEVGAGLQRLNTEIMSGNVPDILGTSNLPVTQYAARGMLADLWPFIEADTELGGREALVQPVFDALSDNGKLYQICSTFMVMTDIGNPELVGDKMGWTLDELSAALAKLPAGASAFGMYETRDAVLRTYCSVSLGNLINWDTGECRFDSKEFIDVLNFAKTFPAEIDYNNTSEYEDDYSRISSGKQLLYECYLSDFTEFQFYKALVGGEATFVGFPTQSGTGSAFYPYGSLAMTENCSNKEGAWEFMRTILEKDYQSDSSVNGFPTNKAAFDAKKTEQMTPEYYVDPETGEKKEQSHGGYGMGDLMVELYAATEEDCAKIEALINATDCIYEMNSNIYEIITDSCAAFFNDQDTAENAAAQVQSRVRLYVGEQG